MLPLNNRCLRGNHNKNAADLLNNFCIADADWRKNKEAIENYKDSLKMCQNIFEGDEKDTTMTLNYIGIAYAGLCNYKEALKYYIEMRKRLFSSDNKQTANTLNKYWDCLFSSRRLLQRIYRYF